MTSQQQNAKLTRQQIHHLVSTAAALQTAHSTIERGGIESARHALRVYDTNASQGRTIDAPIRPIVAAYVDGDTSQTTCLQALHAELEKIIKALRDASAQ